MIFKSVTSLSLLLKINIPNTGLIPLDYVIYSQSAELLWKTSIGRCFQIDQVPFVFSLVATQVLKVSQKYAEKLN